MCDALVTGRWQLFPSVDDVLIEIELRQERAGQERGNSDWENWKRERAYAKRHGLLATEADHEAMRTKLRELFGDPTVRPESKTESK